MSQSGDQFISDVRKRVKMEHKKKRDTENLVLSLIVVFAFTYFAVRMFL